jgi:ABC-type multidrug transport system fused ATPase/permease subunit
MIIGQVARLFIPFSTKYLIDTVVLKHQVGRLPWLVAGAFGATLVEAATLLLVTQLLIRVAERLIIQLRKEVQAHICHLPVSYVEGDLSGVLVSRIMSDTEGLRNLVGPGIMSFGVALLTATMTFFVLVYKSWSITLVVVVVLSFAVLAFRRTFIFIRPLLGEGSKIRAQISGRLTESMGGVRIVKGYCAEDRETDVFAHGVQRLFANTMRAGIGFSLIGFTGALAVGITTALVMLFGGQHLLQGSWTTGDYFQYAAMLFYMVGPVFQLANVGPQFTQAIAGLDRISEVLSECVEDADAARTTRLSVLSGDVRVENVGFAYEPGNLVLHGVSFVARPGTVSALVGPSGSGKSTIISLLCAFHTPTTGCVLIDGIDLSTVRLDSYRSQLGLVLQEAFLFDGTIRENVMFSRPDANEESFANACRIAHVDEFAVRFPNSYDTIVGERGVKLSGGQRQRLSIARAILANPRILILDEATSSLDSESEAMIQKGLSYLMEGRTTFVVAHRLSTVRRADQILVLEAGRVIECGTHEALYEQGGRYYELYTRQYGLEKNLFLAPFEGK